MGNEAKSVQHGRTMIYVQRGKAHYAGLSLTKTDVKRDICAIVSSKAYIAGKCRASTLDTLYVRGVMLSLLNA